MKKIAAGLTGLLCAAGMLTAATPAEAATAYSCTINPESWRVYARCTGNVPGNAYRVQATCSYNNVGRVRYPASNGWVWQNSGQWSGIECKLGTKLQGYAVMEFSTR